VKPLRTVLRYGFMWAEGWLDRAFGAAWNPFYALGALAFFFYWVILVSGIYVYIFFDIGIPEAYDSVEYMTHDQWWLAGIMRSLHRYASDGLVLVMGVHIVREFAFDRYRDARWFSWVIGVPIVWLVFAAGISGYWLVWDKLAQYIAEASTEWLDWLTIFGEPIARNFLAPSHLDDRFFTLMVFIHIALPLILLFIMWFHMQRVSHSKMNPAQGLAVGTLIMLTVLSLVWPATSQGIADLSEVPSPVGLDWWYLFAYPLVDLWSEGPVWAMAFIGTFIMFIMPWLPRRKIPGVAVVDLDNCNGCTRCEVDCPYNAITMEPRTDELPFEKEAVVKASACVGCGICVASCPTSTPFRHAGPLVPGIDLGWLPLAELRERTQKASAPLTGNARVMVFGCDNAANVAKLKSDSIGAVSLPCTGMLPPSFIDYVISRKLADGVVVTGCREGECDYRLGPGWTEERLDGKRDPRLRDRVPRDRVARLWAAPTDWRRFERDLKAFQARLGSFGDTQPPPEGNAVSGEAAE